MSHLKSAQSNKADTNDTDDLITAFIMQYDQRVKISNRRNVEAVERHKAALHKWAAQETNKARIDEAKRAKRIFNKGFYWTFNKRQEKRIAQLTADKEQADG